MCAVSRLFLEIGKDIDKMNESLRQAVTTAEQAGLKVTAAGRSIIASFDQALNPTKALGEQIGLLNTAGKSSADIWAVYGDRLKSAAGAAETNKQAIDPLVAKLIEQNKVVDNGKSSFENLGKTIQDFARNPVEAAKTGITGLLSSLGPTATGIAGVATGVIAAAAGLFKLGAAAADELEHLQNLSTQTGLTTQDLQSLKQISAELGLEGLDLGRTIGALNAQLAQGKGDFVDVLKEMGITIKGQDVIGLLDEIGLKMAAIEDPTERAQFAQGALGGRLRELIPMLAETKGHLREYNDEMKRTGPIILEEQKPGLEALDKAMDAVGRTTSKLWLETKVSIGELLGGFAALATGTKLVTEKLPSMHAEAVILAKAAKEAGIQTQFFAFNEFELAKQAKDATEALEKQNKVKLNEIIAGIHQSMKETQGYADELQKLIDKMPKMEIDWPSLLMPDPALTELKVRTLIVADDLLKPGIITSDWLRKNYPAAMGVAKEATSEFGREVSTIFTNMNQSLAKNIIEWKGWGETLKNAIKGIAEAMLASMIQQFLEPYIKKATDAISGVLGGILKSITGGASSVVSGATSAAGGAASAGAGAASSIASASTSLASGLLAGGISAIGSILGGVISGAMSSKDLGRIEENTRYTAIDQHETVNVLWTLNDTLWVIASRIQETLGQIQYFGLEMVAGLKSSPNTPPGLQHGGIVKKTGWAVVHEGETYSGVNRSLRPTININGPVYGFDDFVERVREAGHTLTQRSDPEWA